MFHTAFDRNIANSKAEFEVKPLQSRRKLALDTSTAKLRFNVNSLYLIVTFCNLPCLSIQEEIETSKKTCWKQSPLVVEENGERSPSDKVNDLNGTSLRSHTSIHRHPPKLRTTPESVLVDCSKDCRLSLWSWYVFRFGIAIKVHRFNDIEGIQTSIQKILVQICTNVCIAPEGSCDYHHSLPLSICSLSFRGRYL